MRVGVSVWLGSYALNMFRTLIYPSSGAYDYSVELPHWSCVLGSMCVGVWVWLGWHGFMLQAEACNMNSSENCNLCFFVLCFFNFV